MASTTNYGCPAPTDTDGDGFPDGIDQCPNIASTTNYGCPASLPVNPPANTTNTVVQEFYGGNIYSLYHFE